MSRNRYRHRVRILRRAQGDEKRGGYGADTYEEIGETSCAVRDESSAEYAAAESAQVEHVLTFSMRTRTILPDDMLIWRGNAYKVARVDHYDYGGREIRVKARRIQSRYGAQEAADGEA